jgi:hypothetical protein
MELQGIPTSEVAKQLEISVHAAIMRFRRHNIRPCGYIGTMALYKEDDIEKIREKLPTGRRAPKYGNRQNKQVICDVELQ